MKKPEVTNVVKNRGKKAISDKAELEKNYVEEQKRRKADDSQAQEGIGPQGVFADRRKYVLAKVLGRYLFSKHAGFGLNREEGLYLENFCNMLISNNGVGLMSLPQERVKELNHGKIMTAMLDLLIGVGRKRSILILPTDESAERLSNYYKKINWAKSQKGFLGDFFKNKMSIGIVTIFSYPKFKNVMQFFYANRLLKTRPLWDLVNPDNIEVATVFYGLGHMSFEGEMELRMMHEFSKKRIVMGFAASNMVRPAVIKELILVHPPLGTPEVREALDAVMTDCELVCSKDELREAVLS